ncbi:hypothetical protein V500_05953 [Pseudogymnoascus sp. VKM F-4518 (FW-2643)]|nr:hypothetical protein V500_05953 [Pseudogymnoascus sp. VKM F-4518 (FW-2643)]
MVSLRFAAKAAPFLQLALATPSDAGTFYSAISNCPAPCAAGSQPSSWTTYDGPWHLGWCNETIMIDFSLHNPLNDPTTHHVIRACTTTTAPRAVSEIAAAGVETYPAKGEIQLISGGGGAAIGTNASTSSDLVEKDDILAAIKHLQSYLGNDNTNATLAFAYSRTAAVGVYLGPGIEHRDAAATLIQKLADKAQSEAVGGKSLLQLCGTGRDADSVFGVVVDSVKNMASIQKIVKTWSEAECATGYEGTETRTSVNVLMTAPIIVAKNVSLPVQIARIGSRRALYARGDCRTTQVIAGSSCASLATKCGISGNDFTSYNSDPKLCSTLQVGQYVCCSAGTLPDRSPKPQPDGTCATYIVKSGDYCSMIAASNSISIANIESFNKNTWGWTGCNNLLLGISMCLSTGNAPMPAPMTNAICGPQVPNTKKPASGQKLADMNQCLLNACCNIWGQCGTTKDFCTVSASESGAPGTSAPGKNGCISNCGTDIVNNGSPPSTFINLAYFEAFNTDRWTLLIKVQAQFDKFTKMTTKSKKILSFGGWSFSTNVDSYPIFRNTVTAANRDTFATNVAKFVRDHGLDGVDFDWEYPGAPDIPGIPPGSPYDGMNYVYFLNSMRDKLADGKSLSIAAPASYWYLKGFPIKAMSDLLDYIVFMTYDLHGQWDYSSKFANPACDYGNCLRSHVNMTETYNALAMITKAGVPASKVVAGITSYGRSFQMTTAGCTGPLCTFTGPESGASPGPCTNTAGYISMAEIKDILVRGDGGAKTWVDPVSQSNIMVYNDLQWVSFMDDENKASRIAFYKYINLGGTTDWAVDLQKYTDDTQCPKGSDDCFRLQFTSKSRTGVDWRSLTCLDPWVIDASQNQTDRWYGVGADVAWADAVNYWLQSPKPNPGGLTFSEMISNFLHQDEGMNCGSTADHNGCTGIFKCNEQDPGPASYFVMGSITAVESGVLNLYDAIGRVESQITTQISDFVSDFAPVPSIDASLKIALDIVSLGFSLAVSPMWNSWLKTSAVFKANPNSLGTIKDWVNPIVTNSITLIKDGMVAGAVLERQNDIAKTLGKVVSAWYSTVDVFNQHLFDGSQSSIDELTSMISDGKMVERPGTVSDLDIQAYLERAIFSILMPRAWELGGTVVFILDSGAPCGAVNPSTNHFGTEHKGANAWACADDKLYYIVGISEASRACSGTPERPLQVCYPREFEVDKLDGRVWGKITREDIVVGAVNTYKANGNKNGGKPADPSNSQTLSDLYDYGVRAPGVMRLAVCNADTAFHNWDNYLSDNIDIKPSSWPPYPWPCVSTEVSNPSPGYVGCYNVHKNPDWMKFDVFTSGIEKVCGDLKGVSINPGSDRSITVPGLKLEDGRDGVFVGAIKNTGQDPYEVDYDYCIEKMGKIRDECHGKNSDTYGGEWHDVIWVVADTNGA